MFAKISSLFSKVEPMAAPVKTSKEKTVKTKTVELTESQVAVGSDLASKKVAKVSSKKIDSEKKTALRPTMTNTKSTKSKVDGPSTAEMISKRAFEIWQEEGCPNGRQESNWLEAEREIKAKLSANC